MFDRQLVQKVLEDHHLSKRIADYMPEKHRPMLTDMFEELLGLHPSDWTLVHQMAETILHLAQMGNVILVGRGAAVVARKLNNVFHVRLMGSLEKRAEQVQEIYGYDRKTAINFIKREDRGRKRFVKEHFDEDPENPLLYDLGINTDRIPYDEAAYHPDGDRLLLGSKTTGVKFRTLSDGEIDFYTQNNNVTDWAGGYAIEGTAAYFIDSISGDYLNVVGLSVSLLYEMLLKIGFDLQKKKWVN